MLSIQQFTNQLFDLRDQYRRDNAWVGKWNESWNDEAIMTRFIGFAYKLYTATARNALRLTVLGGTEIRLDETYVRNFGITAANGIQDKQTERWVRTEQIKRGWRAKNTDPRSSNPDRTPAPVTGTGSILSEKGWTPILNDSLILGAITAGQNFALGLTPAEQGDWQAMNGAKVNKTAVLAARFGDTPKLMNAWKSFLNSQKRMFFFPWGGPRVFTRELLGLFFFGYKPKFSWHQLGFQAGTGKREPPHFRTYLRKLNDVGFQSPSDQAKIMKTISEYLFNDPKAIGAPWPATTKTVV
jgi:hypothetical protein